MATCADCKGAIAAFMLDVLNLIVVHLLSSGWGTTSGISKRQWLQRQKLRRLLRCSSIDLEQQGQLLTFMILFTLIYLNKSDLKLNFSLFSNINKILSK